jgi:PIN domain nuclease of toxin-antitoxin system
MILLDTHVLVWFFEGVPRLSVPARTAIERSGAANEVLVSVISFLEIGMLVAKNRMRLSGPVQEWTNRVVAWRGLSVADLTPTVAVESSFLPGVLHADPADRVLVATARSLDVTLVTHDRRILRYGEQGHVKVMAA